MSAARPEFGWTELCACHLGRCSWPLALSPESGAGSTPRRLVWLVRCSVRTRRECWACVPALQDMALPVTAVDIL